MGGTTGGRPARLALSPPHRNATVDAQTLAGDTRRAGKDLRRTQCFYGQDEKDSACPDLAQRGAEVIRTTGGHHFDGDYEALARRILAGFERRVGPLPLPAARGRRSVEPFRTSVPTELDWALSLVTIVITMLALALWVTRDRHYGDRTR